MKWEQFKNRFRKDAHRQEVDVDMDAIWDAIEPEVDALNEEEPRRRRFIFWIFFTGVLIAGTSWFVLSERNQQDNFLVENKINNTVITNNDESTRTEENLSMISSLEKSEDSDSDSKEVINKNQSDKNQNSNNLKITPHTSQISKVKNTTPSSYIDTKSEEETLRSNQKSPTQKKEISKTNISTSASVRAFANNNKEKSSKSDLDNYQTEKESQIVIAKDDSHPKELLEIEQKFSILPSRLFFVPNEQKSFSILDQLTHVASNNEIPSTNNPSTLLSNDDDDDDDDNRSIKFSVGIHGGASLINRSLKAKNDSENVLLENRNQYETPLEAIHYGFTFGVEHSGFRLSLGIQNTSIAEKFAFDETVVTEDSILGVKTLLLNFTGDTIPIMGMIPETTTVTSQIKTYNSYKLIDIPFSIGYYHDFNEKWNAGINATFITNISLKTKGSIANELAQEINIKAEQNSFFKSKVGLSYQLGLSIGRTFNNKVELSLAPSFRFFPKDFSVDTYGISQKYILIGGNVGLRYRF